MPSSAPHEALFFGLYLISSTQNFGTTRNIGFYSQLVKLNFRDRRLFFGPEAPNH
jgi:hypothetical protein